ncbi:hypothetical protein HU200_022116 [Digitaria exilis]|uniref:WRC domain-containing protein n=1 Tax=Digitaria exilis TaxID=1010633 RepID=A0A835C812_9POAL|nr:hypothetical protein HU200_022116 [Digitaria exilis]CAB3494564.1 unnamed protein product [Digitaria exilis]
MRIRKSAARLLGSAYCASAAAAPGAAAPAEQLVTPPPPPPPPPHLAACSAPLESCGLGGYSSSATASGVACELSRSPWDLIAELSLSDPQVEDDLVDRYFVHVTTRASWLFSASMPVSSSKKAAAAARERAAAARERAKRRRDTARRLSKKAAASKQKDGEASSKAKVKKEEEVAVPVQVWKCKKNDGKRWHCHRTVSQPNTLCSYHFVQKRAYLNPDFELDSAMEPEEDEAPAPAPAPAAASKPSSNSKPRKKKPSSDFNATEGFYYYAGFGPFRSKRHCRSGGTNEPVLAKQEEEEEAPEPEDASPPPADQAPAAENKKNQAAVKAEVSSCDDDIAGIAGVDEDTSDDGYDGIGIAGSSMDPQARNGDGKRKTPWKRWRKPVKARSLMSLM